MPHSSTLKTRCIVEWIETTHNIDIACVPPTEYFSAFAFLQHLFQCFATEQDTHWNKRHAGFFNVFEAEQITCWCHTLSARKPLEKNTLAIAFESHYGGFVQPITRSQSKNQCIVKKQQKTMTWKFTNLKSFKQQLIGKHIERRSLDERLIIVIHFYGAEMSDYPLQK